jgi:hypothetical protein
VPGKTLYLTQNPNGFSWPIADHKGTAFEDLIYSYLKRHVATRDGRVKVKRTRAVGDAGRDFEVLLSGEVRLFGFTVTSPPRKRVNLFIECKSTEQERLDDEFIVDASQHQDSEAYLYILVTNATLTPYCQFRAQQEWNRRNSGFRLVDRRRLYDELLTKGMEQHVQQLGLNLPPRSVIPDFDRSNLAVSCQIQSEAFGASSHIYVAMANYSSESILSQISVATDMQWLAEQSPFERVVMPGGIETAHLTASRINFDGPAELGLSLALNGRSHRLLVSRPQYKLTFEPPFVGREHRKARLEIRKLAENATGFTMISVQGEAGVGKTRTINEALSPLRNGQLEIFTFNFSRHQERLSVEPFEVIFDLRRKRYKSQPEEQLKELIYQGAKIDCPILLHFEDLHHASEPVIKVFKKIVLNPPTTVAPLVVLVTGRDDDTFPNEEYFSFLELINDPELTHVKKFVIRQLTDQEAETLIRSVVVDMPDPGVQRVHALGQNNPFIIVEILQYLLDTHLAQLLSRKTVGILNPEIFAGRSGLPETVEELYDQRLASLRQADGGELATEFLIVASFFGFVIDSDIRNIFFDGEGNSEQCWSLVLQRRFVAQDEHSQQLTFAHENLLHHIRRVVRLEEHREGSARTVLKRPGLFKRLNNFDQGEVHYLAKNSRSAFRCFAEIWTRIKQITNFSSEEINKQYFTYLPMLFNVAKTIGRTKSSLSKVVLAYAYMGVHNYPLLMTEKACALSSKMLAQIYPVAEEGLRSKLAIRQLRAHALQNMGRTGLALKEMLEIEATVIENKKHWPELCFDLFDRLQEFYRKSNHAELCHFYGRRAKRSVDAATDERLRTSHLITHSLVRLYLNEKEARRYSRQAFEAAKTSRIERLITYTRLTQLIVDALYAKTDVALLRNIADEARGLLREAALANFADSIMRLELLLGTLALACYEDPEDRHLRARSYVLSGQANCIRFGNGLFDWAFDNLAAVIDLEDRSKNDEHVRARFRSSFEKLRQRGLTFVGAESGLYPSPFAISNVVRFYSQFRESDAVQLLRSAISAYDNRFLEDDEALRGLVTKATNGRAIFWPSKRQIPILRYPQDNGYFTPIF